MSATPDSTLANPEQRIADLERQLTERDAELAERDAKLAEAREQQTATAELLQVINSSPGDLKPVFDAMLEKATSLCGAEFGLFFTWEGECFHPVAWRGISRELLAVLREPFRPQPGTLTWHIARGENIVSNADLLEALQQFEKAAALDPTETYRNGIARVRALVEFGGARSHIGIALRKDDALLGHLSIFRQEVRPFTDKQIALLQNFAAQAVIAMKNARLLTETREALEQQTATAEVLQVINSSPGDLMPVFDAILEKAHNLCGAEYGALQLYDGEMLRAVATRGTPESVATLLREPHPPGPNSGRLLAGDRFYQSADQAESVARGLSSGPINVAAAKSGTRTLLLVPLRKDKSLIGIISASRFEVKPFSDKQIALLENFAAQAVIAMENARLLGELRQRTNEIAELNLDLEARVVEQVEELGRVGRLQRFLAPQLAELIVSQGDEKILESHRREIVVVFCDLRGYTAFTETAEPEEGLDFLREYHGALGPLVSQYEGTLDHFSGDGIMVFFNDPVPCPDPAERAVKMAMAMREAANRLIAAWRRHGSELGFGIGIAQGYATLGQIGFSDRSGYTAIGTVCNLAARLCAEAKDGQILVSSRIAEAVEAVVKLEDLGNLELKGLRRPVATFNVVQSTSVGDARPNLTVATGPGPN
jgi:class 3 adenylate cyclase